MRSIYLDPFSGISGNMFLGALIAAGYPQNVLEKELSKLHLGEYRLLGENVSKQGLAAYYFDVDLHHDNAAHHEHRHLGHIRNILMHSDLSTQIKSVAVDIFERLAEAEAKVHGIPPEEVHFHEVGAVDTIIDIVGVLLALEYLQIEKVYFGRVVTGFGYVECAHGTMSVPAPATGELLKSVPQSRGMIPRELTTPTGAVLLAALGEYREDLPFRAERVVYGAGKMDLSVPNVLRMYLSQESPEEQELYEAAANLDNENGEILAFVAEQLLAGGAKDVWTEPIYMKKGRPGVKLCYLCEGSLLQALNDYVLENTRTLGIRYHSVARTVLPRKVVRQNTPYGEVRVKIATCSSGKEKSAPEFEDLKALALKKGVSIREINDCI